MLPLRCSRTRAWRLLFLSTLIAVPCWVTSAPAAPTLGFVEDWPGTSLSGWTGGSVYSNPGAGGFGGPGDGFLMVSTTIVTNLGTKSNGPEYLGDWTAAGITQVRVWLNDVGDSQPLEIHFGIGRDLFSPGTNFWQYNVGLIPPFHAWAEYVVDLTSADWTQLHGAGSFASAVQDVRTIHLRHDRAPYVGSPDPIQADFGMDRLLLTNGAVGVEPLPASVSRPVRLAAPVPNPSRGAVALAIETLDPGPVQVQIVDASGRAVRHDTLAEGTTGLRVWTWDGRDDGGRPAPPGLYRARVWSRSGGMSRPLIRLR